MAFLIAVLGLTVGSFLNVCIYRIPKQQSIVSPGSRCPRCGNRLAWFELIPVCSYLLLKGRCRSCRAPVPGRYLLVEVLTGAVFYLEYTRLGSSQDFLTMAFLSSIMIVAAFIDLDHRIIPNRIVLFGLVSGIVLGLISAKAGVAFMALGMTTGFGLLLLVAVISRGQMGMGDVKIAAVMGVFLGWQAVLLAIFFAFSGGGLYGLFLIVFRGKSRKTAVPFGPFLALGTIITINWSAQIISWYLNFVIKLYIG